MAVDGHVSPRRESPGAEVDLWGDLLSRAGGAPASGEAHPEEIAPETPERRAPTSRRARLAAVAALPVFAVALARVVLPAVSGTDSGRPLRPAPVAGATRAAERPRGARQAPEVPAGLRARGRPRVREDRLATRVRTPKPHTSPRTRRREASGHRESDSPVSVPLAAAAPGVPSEDSPLSAPPPESALGAGEPASSRAGTPSGEGSFQDGSHASAEFGL